MIGDTQPTRAERQRLLHRLELADRAAELLRSKEEALERERVRLRGHDERVRDEWERRCSLAFDALLRAMALGAGPVVEDLCGRGASTPAEVEPAWETSMGIRYPGTVRCEPGSAPPSVTTAAIRPAADAYRDALRAGADRAATSAALGRLDTELLATRRRRRAIEQRLRPSLETARRRLDLHLDELDRDQALRVRLAVEHREDDPR